MFKKSRRKKKKKKEEKTQNIYLKQIHFITQVFGQLKYQDCIQIPLRLILIVLIAKFSNLLQISSVLFEWSVERTFPSSKSCR